MNVKFALLILVTVAFSCKRSPSLNLQEPETAPGIVALSEIPTPANPQNPLDSVGIWHNMLLDSVKAYYRYGGKPGTGDQFLVALAKTRFDIDVSRTLPQIAATVCADSASGYTSVLYRKTVSIRLRNLLLELLQFTSDLKGTYDFSKLKHRIAVFESKVLSDASLSEADIRIALVASSVLRHSSWYWLKHQVLLTQRYPEVAASGKFFHWLVGGIVDTVGAISNAIGGGKDAVTIATNAAGASYTVVRVMDDPFTYFSQLWH